ncbi:MAG: transketolase family protein [Bacteroidales bacterium]|nr:MAG: transketolase family protein [Bacteroidales bacterium]
MGTIPCRKAITDTLLEAGRNNPDLFVVTSDARGSVTLNAFAEELPRQFVEVGIAEQNAVGIGTGLALCGKNVFVCGPACFYSARSLEQIKVDVAYSGAPVKIIGVSGGVSYGALGSTHHSLHDVAVMRTLPGLNVYLPSDRFQSAWLTRHLAASEESAYVRVGRNAVPDIYNSNEQFEIGKARVLKSGNDLAIISCGETVYHALKAAGELEKQGLKASVLDMFSIKPFDSETVLETAKRTGCLLTVEEHSILGGLGAAVAELCSTHHPTRMKILGIPDENAVHGKPLEVFAHYGIDAKGIYHTALELLESK